VHNLPTWQIRRQKSPIIKVSSAVNHHNLKKDSLHVSKKVSYAISDFNFLYLWEYKFAIKNIYVAIRNVLNNGDRVTSAINMKRYMGVLHGLHQHLRLATFATRPDSR